MVGSVVLELAVHSELDTGLWDTVRSDTELSHGEGRRVTIGHNSLYSTRSSRSSAMTVVRMEKRRH